MSFLYPFPKNCPQKLPRQRVIYEVAKIHEDLYECEFIDSIRTHNIYPADYPENYNNVMVDEKLIAIYNR